MTEATVIYSRREWLQRGVRLPGQTSQQWAATFERLGGQECSPRPAWQVGAPPGVIAVYVQGTEEAIRFVVDCCHPAARHQPRGEVSQPREERS
ncbi:hypothetical protein ABT352_22635 [Streptosporangium sp. NPDC000563]|uniref:hypothetical protein n=1 Tax=Streptosporangium sp. NPDC000563 TaxID=3154366 RepID=UPI00331BC110